MASDKKRSRLQKNTWKLAMTKLLRNMLFIMPVISLYYTDKGLSLTEIALLQSIFSFALFFFEVPTGYISDKYGRKTSIAVGMAVSVIGQIIYRQGDGFFGFMIAEIILAVGAACISGSDSALLYDTLQQAGKTQAAKKREGRINFAGDLAGIAVGIIGSIVGAKYGFDILRLLTAIVCTIGFLISLTLEEIRDESHQDREFNIRHDFSHVRQTVTRNQTIIRLVVFMGIISYSTYALVWTQQQRLEKLGAPIVLFGVFRGVFRIVIAGTGLLADAYDKKLGDIKAMGGLLIGMFAGYAILALGGHWIIALVGITIAFSMRGLQQPLSNCYVNKEISSSLRATTLSAMSMIHRLFFAIGLPLQGLLGDKVGYQNMFMIMCIMLTIGGLIARRELRKLSRNTHSTNTL